MLMWAGSTSVLFVLNNLFATEDEMDSLLYLLFLTPVYKLYLLNFSLLLKLPMYL